jgi:hypothetical protein
MLDFPDDLLHIPDMLHSAIPSPDTARRLVQLISPEALSEVLRQPASNGLLPVLKNDEESS